MLGSGNGYKRAFIHGFDLLTFVLNNEQVSAAFFRLVDDENIFLCVYMLFSRAQVEDLIEQIEETHQGLHEVKERTEHAVDIAEMRSRVSMLPETSENVAGCLSGFHAMLISIAISRAEEETPREQPAAGGT